MRAGLRYTQGIRDSHGGPSQAKPPNPNLSPQPLTPNPTLTRSTTTRMILSSITHSPSNAATPAHFPTVTPRVVVRVDALRHNADLVRKSVHPETQVYWVLKAEAYGHSFAAALEALSPTSNTVVVVDSPEEAQMVRNLHEEVAILVLSTSDYRSLLACTKVRAIATLSSLVAVRVWAALPKRLRPEAHVQLDTGMQRCGIPASEDLLLIEALTTPQSGTAEKVLGVFSHVPDWHASEVLDTVDTFATRASLLQSALEVPLSRHLGASAAIHPDRIADFDAIRVGDALYGILDALQHPKLLQGLRPAIRYEAQVLSVGKYLPHSRIGYSGRSAPFADAAYFTLRVGYSDLPFLKLVAETFSFRLPDGSLATLMDVGMQHSVFLTTGAPPLPTEWVTFLGGENCPTQARLRRTTDGIAPSFIHSTSSLRP